MTPAATVLTTILTSGVVSTLTTLVLKTYFENKIRHSFDLKLQEQRHQYEIDLERLKADLQARTSTEHELSTRRLTEYPKLVELVYRIRNMSREIASGAIISSTLKDELASRTADLENDIFAFRIDLQRDHLFPPLHLFKNTAKNFSMLLSDLIYFRDQKQEREVGDLTDHIRALYEELERQHVSIIEGLSSSTFPALDAAHTQ